MEFPHLIRNHRDKQRERQISATASKVGAEIIDHLTECGDTELWLPIDDAPSRRTIAGD